MNTKTLQYLNLTPKQYEDKLMETYVDWCASRTAGKRSLQKILTCQPLFNWWQREIVKLEIEFNQDMETINPQNPEACMQAYNFTVKRLYNRFSKPLLKKAYDS